MPKHYEHSGQEFQAEKSASTNLKKPGKSESRKERINSSDRDLVRMYLDEIARFPKYSKEQQLERFRKYKHNGDLEAKKELYQSVLRLVPKIAKNFHPPGMDLLDLIQEGNLGIEKAFEKFKITGSAKFSTYAAHCIRTAIQHAIEAKAHLVYLPAGKQRQGRELYKAEDAHGRPLTEEEQAKELKIPLKKLRALTRDLALHSPVSLAKKITNEGDGRDLKLSDAIKGGAKMAPDYHHSKAEELTQTCAELTSMLNSRQPAHRLNIFATYFGLNDGTFKKKTEEATAEIFGISRQAIRDSLNNLFDFLTRNQKWGEINEDEILKKISKILGSAEELGTEGLKIVQKYFLNVKKL